MRHPERCKRIVLHLGDDPWHTVVHKTDPPMPNALSFLVLLIWTPVAVVLFRRLPADRALIWSILGAYLVLPPVAAFDLPVLPDLDKVTIPNIAALACVWYVARHRGPWLPESPLARTLVALVVFCPVATVLTNDLPLETAAGLLPAMKLQEAVSVTLAQAILLIPFLLGRIFLTSERSQRALLVALMTAGLAYALPMLAEIRLSPQLNVWIYGFFQHDFAQTIRFGGFRPVVFLPHGLWVAFLAMCCAVATLTLWRQATDRSARRWYFCALLLLSLMLVACKTLGPILYALALAPLLMLTGRRIHLLVAAALALLVVAYPVLRETGAVPVDAMVALTERISAERAQSLAFRFYNEGLLLDHAAERAMFGWGGWGRNMVYDAFGGAAVSVSDGRWIVVLGIFGWAGYIGEFGLLLLPLLALLRATWHLPSDRISPWAGTLALLSAANMVDLLPNATLIPLTWLIAGALLGHAERVRARTRAEVEAQARARTRANSLMADPQGPRTVI